jgi:hypothetical protein
MDKRKMMKNGVGDHASTKVNNSVALVSEVASAPSVARRHLLHDSDEYPTTSISSTPKEVDLTISRFPATRRSIRMPTLCDSLPHNQCRRTLRKRPILDCIEDEPIPVLSSCIFSNVSKRHNAGNDNAGDNVVSPSKDNFEDFKDLISDSTPT